ncbi:glycosyltransferase family 4 protein [Candidatus Parcubacteria bacterium]|nr:glycosyltransferase family 4 protein [Patescibacteria group bacterium]MBU4477229.1 glycosyltransferase family 4 protein [Patescibacteria group bacterium]MCG2699168.1 glycosyltransferase family 4 protein [Candidatus Parcubacteria bacterium]
MRFFYISTGHNYPPDKHIIDGLRKNGHTVFELIENGQGPGKYFRFTWRFLKKKPLCDAVIIGFTLPLLTLIVRFISLKKTIFNAVSSQYEANIISRDIQSPRSLAALKWRVIDFISFHLSSIVLLESNAQIDFTHKFFLVPRKKLVRSWMGVDEKVFFYDPNIKKNHEFTVLFRGRFLPESGILTVIETAKKLEDKNVRFLIIGHGFMYRKVNALMEKLKPKNIDMISEKLTGNALRNHMLSCHISLGQLADHPRLSRTLPCKLFESLALGLPYLTGRNAGVLELLKEDENCIAVEPGNSDDLAQKILFLKNNPDMLAKIAEQGYKLYKEKLTSKQLAKEVIDNCFK